MGDSNQVGEDHHIRSDGCTTTGTPRGEPLVSVLKSRKRKPKWELVRLIGLKKRLIDRLKRRNARFKEEYEDSDD